MFSAILCTLLALTFIADSEVNSCGRNWMYTRTRRLYPYNNNNNIYLTAIGLLPGGSGCIHVHIYEKGARNLKPGGLPEKHAVATWSLGNHLSIRL